ncbi:MAG TPA: DUF952 domain-containing protein [Chlamydiales bacterium]|nr:DUF952 domain-containing protein [Chlamydiales bacterium]
MKKQRIFMRLRRIRKIIFLSLGVALLASFGGFNQRDLDAKELSLKASVLLNPDDHTMGNSLLNYIDPKVHHLLKEKEFKNIWVVGDSDRTGTVSNYEKSDKLFNWQRPTATIRGEDLYIKVFPGREYVKHYATLIGTYFALQKKDGKHVHYVLPDEAVAWKALTSSNLKEVPKGDVAVLGYGLEQLIGDEEIQWEGKGNFSWVKKQIGDKTVVFIGGKHSYWGDISGRIVRLLAKQGFKQVIYVGKVGGMNRSGIPNQTLATGDTSFVDGETIRWKNLFDFAKDDNQVVFGEHYTIPSVMNETKEWLEKNKNYAFVDNEIGFMAKAAQSEGIQFSYLHIISDNLNGGFEEDLTNERGAAAKEHRTKILQKAKSLIEESLVRKGASLRAAIDFGSGSIKIQTAHMDLASQKIVGEPLMLKYVPLTLSEDVASHGGYISIQMQQKALVTLAKFKEEVLAIAASKGYPDVEFSGISTAVFRKAENGKDLLHKIEKDLGIHFQILSQEEEGRLGFLSAKILYPEIDEENLLVWDSGNGSFQITAKIGDTYKIYQGPLGHGTVRVLLSKEIRGQKVLEGHVSGNPVQIGEASQLAGGIENLLPEIPSWLQDKLHSKKTVVVTFGDGESIFALVSRALGKSSGDAITRLEAQKVLEMSLGRDDDFFDSNGLHRKTGTSALLVSSIMDHFDLQTIYYKTAVGNTSGILGLPDLWKESYTNGVNMEEKPTYLYKVLSTDDWAKSRETVHLSSMDADFIHLSTEDQLDRIIKKYWTGVSKYIVLKIETAKLPGELILEANPGGTNKYYHLYNGSIPLTAIVESICID